MSQAVETVVTDGRDIDQQLAELTGEASHQWAPKPDKHLEKVAEPWRNLPEAASSDPTYYDRPVLKAPVWSWMVPAYYFVGGASGAAFALGAAAQLDGSGELNRLIRHCHWTGIVGSTISGALLIADLGKPSRFLNMLRVFRPTSPMNMGVWILSGAAPTATVAGLLLRRPGILGAIGEWFGFASGLFGLGLATYTGVLVGNSVVPVWRESRRMLPLLFGASAVASAGSLFDFFPHTPQERRITYTFGMAGRVAELTAAVAMGRQLAKFPEAAKPLRGGWGGALWRLAGELTAASLITSLLPGRSRKKQMIAGALGAGGSIALRYAIHRAGIDSSRDPRATFQLQREGRPVN